MSVLDKIPRLAAPADPSSLIDWRSGRKKRVTKKLKIVIQALLRGESRTTAAAAEKAGLSADYVYRALALPHVRAFVVEQIATLKASGALLAMPRLVELLRSESAHVSLDATKLMLAINGHRPETDPNVAVNVLVTPGYVIDLRNPRDDLPASHPLSKQFTKEISHEERDED